MKQWFVAIGGQRQGPIELAQVQSMLAAGQMGAQDLVWREGMATWLPAHQVPEVSAGAAGSEALEAVQQPQSVLAYQGPAMNQVSPRVVVLLSETRPWVRFMAILIFVVGGLMAFAGLAIVVLVPNAGGRGFTAVVGLLYLATAALCILSGILLSRYALRIDQLQRSSQAMDLESAIEAQKSFWKFVGILTLVILAIYVVVLVVVVIAAVA